MKVTVLLLVTCELCWTIRVPVTWGGSESDENNATSDEEFSVESFKPQDANGRFKPESDSSETKPQDSGGRFTPQNEKPIPVEYFEYTAKKPQFAIDVAAFHGVQSPENHYKAYPIRPYTGRVKLELGKHHILDSSNTLHQPFQDYTKINEDVGHAKPVSSNYEVFHPYEAETPALQEIYRDPVLNKIRNDLENSKNRLQQYEKDAGEPDITKDEYLESPQKTDSKLFPHRHRPAPYEIHRPQRRPVYYRPVPVYKTRENYLNQKFRHPWNHNIAKVRPMHYRPIQNHIHKLRQNHALKYDDERNEYPQVQIYENYSDPKDGQDIYERGKDKFVQLRNNVDESINKAVKENRPETYAKLEVQNNDSASDEDESDEDEFVPIKNYAQVRKTELFRHLPRAAALEDADTFDEIKNAPRLREAIKSTKAQTVYSEEGYEDGAYDHAGEQKHASENEGHGGYLKENELSGGKYKTPSVSANYEDGAGSVYRDQNIHAEKWKDENKDTKEEVNEEDYVEEEHEHLLEADNHQTEPDDEDNHRNKREDSLKNNTELNSDIKNQNNTDDTPHEFDKREANFEVPQIDLNSTFFKDIEFLKIVKPKVVSNKDTIKQKYPYYFKNLKTISKNSPLRYAENLKLIPKKSKGGTEFYDSRSRLECPEVDDVPDPIPEKLKKDGHPDESDDDNEKPSSNKGDENFDTAKKQPRLKGLGDKIDCFKAKYFGENPLDSPFFKEEVISNPEPVFLPNIAAYQLKTPFLLKQNKEETAESKPHNSFEKLQRYNTSDLFELLEKLRSDEDKFQKSTAKSRNELVHSLEKLKNHSNLNDSQLAYQSSVYNDIIKNIQTNLTNVSETSSISNGSEPANNITYTHFQNKEDITKPPLSRKKRAAPFVYEPYKIIKEGHIQDDLKKSAVPSNVSPLIRQLQTSKAIETVNNLSLKDAQHVKRNTRTYKDIGLNDREIKYGTSKNDKSYEDAEIVDVSVDTRRGEPRYEIKHENHKTRYTPITNTKSMTIKEYEAQVINNKTSNPKVRGESDTSKPGRQRPTDKPFFDVSMFIPKAAEIQSTTPSYTVKKTVGDSTLRPQISTNSDENKNQDKDSESDEDYEEYDEDDEEITTTTTTRKPAPRRKTQTQATIQEPLGFIEEPRLRLVTRFRDHKPKIFQEKEHKVNQMEEYHPKEQTKQTVEAQDENVAPKFRVKKKKVTQSTLVTDSKRYGDVVEEDDKMMKDEVDALIGVKYNMDDYVPPYEKDEENKSKERNRNVDESKKSKEDVNKNDDNDEDEDEDEDYDEDDNDDDDDHDDDDEDDYDEDDDDDENDEKEDVSIEKEPKITTPEPTKRSLVITTDAPVPTTASRSAKLQSKPIVTRKKIEIHKELPVNKSSPHITQFKQDIKEIEIIKENPNPLKRKPNKHTEVFDLYKDDNLAKDINMLGVEIFKENLDLRQGPKHGGNYRSADEITSTVPAHTKTTPSKNDAETSQSEYKRKIEFDENASNRNERKPLQVQRSRSRSRNPKQIEPNDTPHAETNESNLKHRGRSQNNAKSQKLIEFSDEDDEDSSSDSPDEQSYRSSSRGKPMHGGNYRSAKLIKEPTTTESTETRSKDARQNAALVLSSFVQAAPVLSNKPRFILDPSKRKYYYVDA